MTEDHPERQARLQKRLKKILDKLDYSDQADLEGIIDGLEEINYEAGYAQAASNARGDYW